MKPLCLCLGLYLGLLSAAFADEPKVNPEIPVVRHAREAMGTVFTLTVADPLPAELVERAALAAFDEIDRLEALLSEWRETSEISAVNRAAGLAPVVVSAETFECVSGALEVSQLTDGAFDLTWAAFRGLWKFSDETPPRLPDPARIKAALLKVGFRKVKADKKARTLFLEQRGMTLGLGGIGQGFAVDRAVIILRAHGLSRFIVDGGGDLYVAGEKAEGRPWVIGVQHPRDRGRLVAELPLPEGAVVTSGDYERYFEIEGRRYHHIIDLRTGYPATGSVSATVFSADATLADALATGLFVMGPKGLSKLEAMPGVEAAVFSPDGRIEFTSGLKGRFPARWQK